MAAMKTIRVSASRTSRGTARPRPLRCSWSQSSRSTSRLTAQAPASQMAVGIA